MVLSSIRQEESANENVDESCSNRITDHNSKEEGLNEKPNESENPDHIAESDKIKSLECEHGSNGSNNRIESKPELTDVRDTNTGDALTEEPPDGGYGWVIVVCCLLVMTNYGSNWVMFSVYNIDFSETFDRPQAQIGIIGSVDAAFSQAVALPSGAFASLYGSRAVCMLGLLVYGTGTFLSAFAPNFYVLILTYGVIKGSGVGMIFVPTSLLVQKYFTKKRALAAGISSCGVSLGSMLFGPIHRLLISSYGWRGGLILTSGIIFQMIVCAALMRPLRVKKKHTTQSSHTNQSDNPEVETIEEHKQSCCTPCNAESNHCVSKMIHVSQHLRKALNPSVFRDFRFPLFLAIKSLSMFGTLSMYKFSVVRAVHFGIDKLSASFLMTSIGIASSVFRNVGGLIGSIKGVDRLLMFSVTTSAGGIIAILSIAATSSFPLHVLFHLLYGSFLGLSECLLATVITDLFTIARLPVTLGWLMVITGTVSLIYMPIFGLLFDVTGSFSISYIFGGTVQILAGFCGVGIIVHQRALTKRTGTSIANDEKGDESPNANLELIEKA